MKKKKNEDKVKECPYLKLKHAFLRYECRHQYFVHLNPPYDHGVQEYVRESLKTNKQTFTCFVFNKA